MCYITLYIYRKRGALASSAKSTGIDPGVGKGISVSVHVF